MFRHRKATPRSSGPDAGPKAAETDRSGRHGSWGEPEPSYTTWRSGRPGRETEVLQFVIAGLVLGGIYAIASAGLVITYTSSGILNFAFGAHRLLHRPLLLLPPHPGVLGHPAGRRGRHRDRLARTRDRPLRRPLPPPAAVVAADQGGGHRSACSVAIPSLATLIFGNQAIQQAPGPGPRAGQRLPLPRGARDPGPDHRLRLRRRDRGGRRAGPALHRGRPQGAGHGRLAGHDRPVGNEPDGGLGRRVGGQHASSPAWPVSWPHPSSGSTPPTSRC